MKLEIKISDDLKSKVEQRYKVFSKQSKRCPGIDTDHNPNVEPDWLDYDLMSKARALAKKYFAR